MVAVAVRGAPAVAVDGIPHFLPRTGSLLPGRIALAGGGVRCGSVGGLAGQLQVGWIATWHGQVDLFGLICQKMEICLINSNSESQTLCFAGTRVTWTLKESTFFN